MGAEIVTTIPYFGLTEIIIQQASIDSQLSEKGLTAAGYLNSLIGALEKNRQDFHTKTDGFEIPDLPNQVQEVLGNPKAKYSLEIRRNPRITNIITLNIRNLEEKDKGLKVEFYIQKEGLPFGFQFLTINENPKFDNIVTYQKIGIIRQDSRLCAILAAMILGTAVKHFT